MPSLRFISLRLIDVSCHWVIFVKISDLDEKLLISNETSAIHIAAALDVQSICILGGGHYGRFTPYPLDSYKKRPISVVNEMFCFQCNWNCYIKHSKNKPFPCIDLIEFKEVLKKANNYL